jgi:hypothetical protein
MSTDKGKASVSTTGTTPGAKPAGNGQDNVSTTSTRDVKRAQAQRGGQHHQTCDAHRFTRGRPRYGVRLRQPIPFTPFPSNKCCSIRLRNIYETEKGGFTLSHCPRAEKPLAMRPTTLPYTVRFLPLRFMSLRCLDIKRTSSYMPGPNVSSRPFAVSGSTPSLDSKNKYEDESAVKAEECTRYRWECSPTLGPNVGLAHFDARVSCVEWSILHPFKNIPRVERVCPPSWVVMKHGPRRGGTTFRLSLLSTMEGTLMRGNSARRFTGPRSQGTLFSFPDNLHRRADGDGDHNSPPTVSIIQV